MHIDIFTTAGRPRPVVSTVASSSQCIYVKIAFGIDADVTIFVDDIAKAEAIKAGFEAAFNRPEPELYRGYIIEKTRNVPSIPGWERMTWSYRHKDYDGEGDPRHGHAASAEVCRDMIDAEIHDTDGPEDLDNDLQALMDRDRE